MAHPQTIQIFLPSGDPQGIRVAAITTRIVQVIEVPRARLDEFLKMPEATYVGLYVLFGEDDETGESRTYIGQTGNFGVRLKQHNEKKEFWNRALIALSLTRSLTVTHAHFLEWLAISRATEAQRFGLENGTAGSKPHTPAPMEAECLEVFETVGVLLTTLGYPLFEPLIRQSLAAEGKTSNRPDGIDLFLHGDGVEGRGRYTEEGLVVLANSLGKAECSPSFEKFGSEAKRRRLIEAGSLLREGARLRVVKDMLFSSPSAAAAALFGRSSNGWVEWKDASGRTLSDVMGRNKPTEGAEG